MSDILDMTLASLAQALKEKKISAAEAAGACLDRMEATEPRLCAMLHIDREGALAQAKAMDDKGPEADKPLWGVPVTVKDALEDKRTGFHAGADDPFLLPRRVGMGPRGQRVRLVHRRL